MMLTLPLMLLAFAVVILALLILAWIRNPVVAAIYRVAGLFATPFAVIALGLQADIAGLRKALRRAGEELPYSSEHTPAHLAGKATLWDIVSPLALLACLVVLVAADIYFSDIRFAVLLSTRPHVLESGFPAGTLAAA